MAAKAPKLTLGAVIKARRTALQLSQKALGERVTKEDGAQGLSSQYLHDIEKDRRTPSTHVLDQIAKVIAVDADYLRAVAGIAPDDVIAYLRENPEAAPPVAALFKEARRTKRTNWS